MSKLLIHTCLFLLVAIPALADITFLSDRDGKRNIYVMNDDGSNVRRLTDTPLNVGSPRWSPDGSQIAFMMDLHTTQPNKWQQYDVFVMNADGTQQRNLTQHPKQDGFPCWSPDGKYLVFERAEHTTLEIFVIELATRKIRQLTDFGLRIISELVLPMGKRSPMNSREPERARTFTSWMLMVGITRPTDQATPRPARCLRGNDTEL